MAEKIGHQKRYVWLSVIFLIGLALCDQALLRAGNHFVTSPYWTDSLVPNLLRAKDSSIFILGDCRAALSFDSSLIEQASGYPVFNTGRVVDSLGTMDLTLNIILSHKKPRYVVVVLDDGLWQLNLDLAREDFDRRSLSWNSTSLERSISLTKRYKLNSLWMYSGLWMFKGLGPELYLANFRRRHGQPTRSIDGYDPRAISPNIGDQLKDPLQHKQIDQSFISELKPTEFSKESIEHIFQQIVDAGITPIAVLAPMHRLRASAKANREQKILIEKLAHTYSFPVLDYLNNEHFLSENDMLWSDPGHFNRLGAEEFSKIFAKDLKNLLDPKNKGANL